MKHEQKVDHILIKDAKLSVHDSAAPLSSRYVQKLS